MRQYLPTEPREFTTPLSRHENVEVSSEHFLIRAVLALAVNRFVLGETGRRDRQRQRHREREPYRQGYEKNSQPQFLTFVSKLV